MKTSYAVGIGIAVVLAITLVVAGIQATQNLPSLTSSTLSTSQGVSTTSSGTTQSRSSGAGASSTSEGSHPTGDFAMMATDPPVAASGVSSAIVTYNGLAVHSAGSSSASGWTQIDASGTINLMSSVNVSQTIASSQVQTGTYDMVAMNVTSGTVVYNGQTYNAAIASGNLQVQLNSDVQVNSSASSAAIIDLRTFVINAGNASSPQFVISASAKATAVPSSDVTTASLQVGATSSLQDKAWWTGFEDQTSVKVDVTSATLTSNSLSLTLSNSGNASGQVQTVVVTPVSANTSATVSLPASLSTSAVFTVDSSGGIQTATSLQGAILVNGTGNMIGANSTSTISFQGTIGLSLGSGSVQVSGVIPGQTYLVTVMGANTFANVVVVAQ